MKGSRIAMRGAKGYSWYQNYVKNGPQGFRKAVPPTPFDWSGPPVTGISDKLDRSKVFFDISIDSNAVGRLTFELADDVVPKTVENFRRLCTGESEHGFSYSSTKFHQVQKGAFVMGGDVENNDGTGSHSAEINRYIRDENFIIPHTGRGLLSMASVGIDTGGSQFYIALNEQGNSHMNGRCVVFGRIIGEESDKVLTQIEKVFTFRGVPSSDVLITASGFC